MLVSVGKCIDVCQCVLLSVLLWMLEAAVNVYVAVCFWDGCVCVPVGVCVCW